MAGCRPRAVLALIGGVLVHLALGAYYTFGNIAPYIISYLRLKSGESWIKNVDSLWISTVGSLPGPLALVIGNIAPYIISYLRLKSGEPWVKNVDSLWISTVGSLPGPLALVIGGAIEKNFGNIAPYIISYLGLNSGEPWVKNVDSLWISTVGSLPGPLALIIGGAIEKNFGARIALTLGCLIYSAGTALTYFSVKASLALVTMTYGALISLGTFIAYGIPIQAAAMWFPNHQTLVIGVILCGFGGSTLIMNQVITGFINPDNLSPDLETPDGEKYFTNEDMLNRLPYIFLILAGIYVGLSVAGIAMISQPANEVEIVNDKPTYVKLSEDSDESDPIVSQPNKTRDLTYSEKVDRVMANPSSPTDFKKTEHDKNKARQSIVQTLKTLLKDRNSYVIAAFMFFIFAGMQFNISLYKAYGQTFISDDKFLALVGSIAAVFNCICRPFWGFLMDKYGFHVTTKILAASFVCIMTTLPLTEKLGKAAFMIWICASYGSFCGIFPIGPSALAKLFGKDNMIINMSFTFVATTAATLFGGFSGLTLKDTVGWHGLFLLSGCLGVTGIRVIYKLT